MWNTPEYLVLAQELSTGADRTVALIGQSYVDEALRLILLKTLHSESPELQKSLARAFEPEGFLGSFPPKVTLAASLKLFGRTVYKDMLLVNDIRRTFAHKISMTNNKHKHEAIAFTTPSIRDKCKQLAIPKQFHMAILCPPGNSPPSEARSQYITTIHVVASALYMKASNFTTAVHFLTIFDSLP